MSQFSTFVFVSSDDANPDADLEQQAEKMLEKYNIESNQDGHLDSWEIDSSVEPESRDQLLQDFEEGFISNAVITPEGKWVEGPSIYYPTDSDTPPVEFTAWKEQVTDLMEKYKDATIFVVSCHI